MIKTVYHLVFIVGGTEGFLFEPGDTQFILRRSIFLGRFHAETGAAKTGFVPPTKRLSLDIGIKGVSTAGRARRRFGSRGRIQLSGAGVYGLEHGICGG